MYTNYTDTIFRDLDLIGELTFNNELPSKRSLFISDKLILPKNIRDVTILFLQNIPLHDFINVNVVDEEYSVPGLERNSLNSIGNQVNPESIKKLKKMLAYALHYLKNNWKEIEKNNEFVKIEKPQIIVVNGELRRMVVVNHLSWMAGKYKVSDKVTITTLHDMYNNMTIEAHPKDLSHFMNILRKESEHASLKTYDCPNTRLFMCIKNEEKWMATCSPFPKELIEKIVKMMYFVFINSPPDMSSYFDVESNVPKVQTNSHQKGLCTLF